MKGVIFNLLQAAVTEAHGADLWDDLVDDAARLIREWGRGPVVYIGLSMGGLVGQGLAIRHPELVRGLAAADDDVALVAPDGGTGALYVLLDR